MSYDPKNVIERAKDRSDGRYGHPELEVAYEVMTHQMLLSWYDESVPRAERLAQSKAAMEMWTMPSDGTTTLEEYVAPGCPEEPDTTVDIYVAAPAERTAKLMPAIFWCCGSALASHIAAIQPYDSFYRTYGAIMVVPDYRTVLNDDGNYPAAVNDLHAGYVWTVEHAEELGIDPKKIVIYGGSSGGQLAIALCHRLKRYGITPKGCISDMGQIALDTTKGSGAFVGCGWDSRHVKASTDAWLGDIDRSTLGPEAFPALATVEDCVGLPPMFIHAPECDPSTSAALGYADKLLQAGTYVELHLWGGADHGVWETDVEHGRLWQNRTETLLRNFHDIWDYDLRRPWLLEE